MSEIPEAIMEDAEKTLYLMLCNCREAGDVRADSIMDIAKALLAAEKRGVERERERCAGVAEHYAQQWDTGGQDGEGSIGFHACMQVADHIRGS